MRDMAARQTARKRAALQCASRAQIGTMLPGKGLAGVAGRCCCRLTGVPSGSTALLQ